ELAGAIKLTGQQGGFRYGLLAAAEEDTHMTGTQGGVSIRVNQDGRDFAIGRLLYEQIAGTARYSLGWIGTEVDHPQVKARTSGLDAHHLTASGKLSTDIQLLHSEVDGIKGEGGFADFKYTPVMGVTHGFKLDYFDPYLDISHLGFLRRNDLRTAQYNFDLNESGLEQSKVQSTSISLNYSENTDGQLVDGYIFGNRFWEFHNNARFGVDLLHFPGQWDDRTSEGNGSFRIRDRWETGFFWGNDRSLPVSVEASTFFGQHEIEGNTRGYRFGVTWRPSDRLSMIISLGYENKKGWLIHTFDRELTTYNAEYWKPKMEIDFFLSARQQFRITAQWVGIKAVEDKRWEIPLAGNDLSEVAKDPLALGRDFTISRLTFQARYRWEIAPLSDLFVVYTRGSDVGSTPGETFDTLLSDAWTHRLVDVLVVKLRYRLGS
ncbi:MAG: DUF5916 domain-containing protein, partial [Gammaproteobacteria bacterium]|nr:DUF5916 domain-containing protein [Gammaproteobacteria bacterium]